MKFSLKRLKDVLRGFFTKRARMIRLMASIFAGFFTKRDRILRLMASIFAVALLCVILSGFTLTHPTSGYQPSDTNGATEPEPVAPNYLTSEPISNRGSLKTIGIGAYWDENSINKVNWIDWGTLEPGAQNNVVMYFQNEGNSAVTLSKSISNWNPPIVASYLTLSWDYNGQAIEAGKTLQVRLTLSVSETITGITDFSFDIIVAGTG